MTLSGLALAIGILVDQATVTIENIHQHLEMGKDKKQAIVDACSEISFPLLLILLCILAVFAPAFVMTRCTQGHVSAPVFIHCICNDYFFCCRTNTGSGYFHLVAESRKISI